MRLKLHRQNQRCNIFVIYCASNRALLPSPAVPHLLPTHTHGRTQNSAAPGDLRLSQRAAARAPPPLRKLRRREGPTSNPHRREASTSIACRRESLRLHSATCAAGRAISYELAQAVAFSASGPTRSNHRTPPTDIDSHSVLR
jgi:hypothetical protein